MSPPARRRVLVVEDSPDARESLRILLRLWGYEVMVAGDGAEGVEKALTWRPHAAVVDIGLPKLDGFQVAERVRAALHEVRLIALTAYSGDAYRDRARACGFDAFLAKPADLDDLAALLRSVD